jgi:hypothetical protein
MAESLLAVDDLRVNARFPRLSDHIWLQAGAGTERIGGWASGRVGMGGKTAGRHG